MTSLAIFPTKNATDGGGVGQAIGVKRSSSIIVFRMVFVIAVLVTLELVFKVDLLVILVTWLPVAFWALAEIRKVQAVKF